MNKIAIKPGLVERPLLEVSAQTGLNEKTLAALNKGGEQKLETALQLQRFLGTRSADFFVDDDPDINTGRFVESRSWAGMTCNALSSSGSLFAIEQLAVGKHTTRLLDEMEKPFHPVTGLSVEGEYEFTGYSTDYRMDDIGVGTDRGEDERDVCLSLVRSLDKWVEPPYLKYRVGICDDLLPLSDEAAEKVRRLDKVIEEIWDNASTAPRTADSFSELLQHDALNENAGPKKEFVEILAELKRCKIRLFVQNLPTVLELVDEDGELEEEWKLCNLPEMRVQRCLIVLAPTSHYRLDVTATVREKFAISEVMYGEALSALADFKKTVEKQEKATARSEGTVVPLKQSPQKPGKK